MATIHLVRHGQASFGAADYDQLSPLGARQSALLGEWLARTGRPVARLASGRLRRHRQTAQACVAAWQGRGPLPAMVEDGGFDEFDHREILLRSRPDFAAPDALQRFLAAEPDSRRAFQRLFAAAVERWMGGDHNDEYRESWQAFRARCLAALERTAAGEGDVWVFTSGGPIAAIAQHVLELSDRKMLELNWSIANTSVTRLAASGGGFRLGQFNAVAHLEAPGAAELITYR